MSNDEQSHLEIILEDINGKFDLVLEGHVTLEHMIQTHREETRQDKQELLALIKTSHDSLDAKIDETANRLDAKIDETTNRLDAKIDETTNRLDAKIDETTNRLDAKIDHVATDLKIEIQKVGKKVDGYEQRIQYLERRVA